MWNEEQETYQYLFLVNDRSLVDTIRAVDGAEALVYTSMNDGQSEFSKDIEKYKYSRSIVVSCLTSQPKNDEIEEKSGLFKAFYRDGYQKIFRGKGAKYLSRAEHADELMTAISKYISESEGGSLVEPSEPVYEPFVLQSAADLIKKDIPPLRVFIHGNGKQNILVEGVTVLAAKAKAGKSWFSLAMCDSLVRGTDFLDEFKVEPCHAVYFDVEEVAQLQQEKLKAYYPDGNPPASFYIQDKSRRIGEGFKQQIEDCMSADPLIGLIVIDVFQKIQSDQKSKESDYNFVYRDFTVLKELADRYHIAIVVVCHSRKNGDPNDPCSNILGSTAFQGASDEMIVLWKDKYNAKSTHVFVNGRTIGESSEFDMARQDNGAWTICTPEIRAENNHEGEYDASEFKPAILALMTQEDTVSLRCGQIIAKCKSMNISIPDSPKDLGSFLSRFGDLLLKKDNIMVEIKPSGTASNTYCLQRVPFDSSTIE